MPFVELPADVRARLAVEGARVRDVDWLDFEGHDWRQYVPFYLRSRWVDLADETRGAIYVMADKLAHPDPE